jgi:MFS family permease
VALLREFGWSRSLLAGAFSLFVLVHGLAGAPLGWLADRIGPRRLILVGGGVLALGLFFTGGVSRWWQLYLAFGVVTALGVSASGWVPTVLLIQRWFPNRIGTSMGVASAGIGMGIFGMGPLSQLLIEWMGWRWAFRILSALGLALVVPSALWLLREPGPRREPGRGRSAESHRATESREWTLATALRSLRFWGLGGVFFAGSFTSQFLLVHQVAYFVDHGLTPLVAASVVGVVGLASVAGKVGWGWLSDLIGRELTFTLGFSCVVLSVGMLGLFATYPWPSLPFVYGVLIGVGYAVTAPLSPAASSDLFRGRHFGAIFGTLSLATSFGGAVGAWAGGWIFDLTRSYAWALVAALVFAVGAPVLLWLVAPRRPNPPPG